MRTVRFVTAGFAALACLVGACSGALREGTPEADAGPIDATTEDGARDGGSEADVTATTDAADGMAHGDALADVASDVPADTPPDVIYEPVPTCGAVNCAGGCCDSNMQCIPPSSQSATQCGLAGAACGSCASGESCDGGTCTCGGSTCTTGCCNASGMCVSPTNATCGANGVACTACSPSSTCCPSGCADLQSDARNCGICGHSCLGGKCVGGTCQPYVLAAATDTGAPSAIVVDGTNAYWAASASGGANVLQCALAGCGGAPMTLATGQNPQRFVIPGPYLMWTNEPDTIMSCPIGSGPASAYVTGLGGGPFGLATDDVIVWSERDAGTIMGCPIHGCFMSSGTAYVSGVYEPRNVQVDYSNMYWTAGSGGAAGTGVFQAPLPGGTVTTLATAADPLGLAIDIDPTKNAAANVYWTDTSRNLVARTPVGGGSTTTIAAGQINPTGLTIDSTYLYWTTNTGAGSVVKWPLAGGSPTTIVSNRINPNQIAATTYQAAAVCWTTSTAVECIAE